MYIFETINSIIDVFENESESILIGNNYIKGDLIGSGGFGEVYKYHHKLLNMDFAVKFFSPAFPIDEEKNKIRFFQEARIMFELHHKNIISVNDVGILNGKPYIIMEYFNGNNLNEVLDKYGVLSPEKALTLIINITDAMIYAHKKVVHRDLKLSNIMVAKKNQFRIIDFGLGIYIEKQLYSRLTSFGKSPAGGLFTAPELISNPTIVDPRSDIYSIGAIWYAILVGQAPSGSQIRQNLLNIKGVSERYAKMILKCLNNIDDRYCNLNELMDDIEEFKR